MQNISFLIRNRFDYYARSYQSYFSFMLYIYDFELTSAPPWDSVPLFYSFCEAELKLTSVNKEYVLKGAGRLDSKVSHCEFERMSLLQWE